MNYYGQRPTRIDQMEVDVPEMMFYQYLPIKMADDYDIRFEKRLDCFKMLIGRIACDYVGFRGLDKFKADYMYLSCKYMWQAPGCSYNRLGWHCDGFMTDDINYIWSDSDPTLFNLSKFNLTMDDKVSMKEMEEQVNFLNNCWFYDNTILRLDQYNVHRVQAPSFGHMRKFVKVSFSPDKYNLSGNSHNYEFDYDWPLIERKIERNIPQAEVK